MVSTPLTCASQVAPLSKKRKDDKNMKTIETMRTQAQQAIKGKDRQEVAVNVVDALYNFAGRAVTVEVSGNASQAVRFEDFAFGILQNGDIMLSSSSTSRDSEPDSLYIPLDTIRLVDGDESGISFTGWKGNSYRLELECVTV